MCSPNFAYVKGVEINGLASKLQLWSSAHVKLFTRDWGSQCGRRVELEGSESTKKSQNL